MAGEPWGRSLMQKKKTVNVLGDLRLPFLRALTFEAPFQNLGEERMCGGRAL